MSIRARRGPLPRPFLRFRSRIAPEFLSSPQPQSQRALLVDAAPRRLRARSTRPCVSHMDQQAAAAGRLPNPSAPPAAQGTYDAKEATGTARPEAWSAGGDTPDLEGDVR